MVFNCAGHTVCMDNGVVPRRHGLAMCMLAWVPGGRDVGLGALEGHHGVDGFGECSPRGVRSCHVANQGAMFASGSIEKKRYVIGKEFSVAQRYPGAQWLRPYERMQNRDVR